MTEREQHQLDGNADLQIAMVESTSVVTQIQAQQPEEEQATTTAVNRKRARKESGLEQPGSSAKQVTAVNHRRAKKPTGLQKPRVIRETSVYRPPIPVHLRPTRPRLPSWHRANGVHHSTSISVQQQQWLLRLQSHLIKVGILSVLLGYIFSFIQFIINSGPFYLFIALL